MHRYSSILSNIILHSRIWGDFISFKDVCKFWVDIFDFESWLVDVAALSRFAALSEIEATVKFYKTILLWTVSSSCYEFHMKDATLPLNPSSTIVFRNSTFPPPRRSPKAAPRSVATWAATSMPTSSTSAAMPTGNPKPVLSSSNFLGPTPSCKYTYRHWLTYYSISSCRVHSISLPEVPGLLRPM